MSQNSIKSSIVSLNVDIDDKKELFRAIHSRIETERNNLAKIDRDLEDAFQLAVHGEATKLKSTLESISKETTLLLEKKKNLFSSCEKTIDNIKAVEKYLASETRKIYNETEEKLEQERKVFKSNFETRLQAAVASKYASLKEGTDRAIQPELERIVENQKKELNAIEQKYKIDEMKMVEDYSRKLSIALEEEKSVILDHRKLNHQASEDKFHREVQAVEREHKFRVVCLKEELDKELEKHKETVQAKLEKERKESRSELSELEMLIKAKLDEARSQHTKETSILEKAQQEKVKEIKKRHLDRITLLTSSSSSLTDASPPRSPSKSKTGASLPNDNPELIELKKKLLSDRDSKIQSEIRNMQTETVKLERELVISNNEEKKKIKDAFDREERLLMTSLEAINDQIADIIVDKERLVKESKITSETNIKLASEISELEKEIEVFENGIRVQRMRCRDNKLTFDKLISEQESTLQSQIDDIKANCDRLANQLQQRDGELKLEVDQIIDQHEQSLESLDADVKAQLVTREQELSALADEQQIERVKIAKYEKLIITYKGEK